MKNKKLLLCLFACFLFVFSVFPESKSQDKDQNQKNMSDMYGQTYRVVVPVLCYHRFSRTDRDKLTVNEKDFEEQLIYLKKNNFRSVSLTQLQDLLKGEKKLDFRPVLITADDGYQSFYDIAFPLLKKYGFTAVLFVYTDFISISKKALSWADLKMLVQSGFEVGSHSKTHFNLAYLKDMPYGSEKYRNILRNELNSSKEIIEQHLKVKVNAFAVPYGTYDEEVIKIAKESGYKLLFTTNFYSNTESTDVYRLGRFIIMGDEGFNDFVDTVESLPLQLKDLSPSDGTVLENNAFTISAVITDPDVEVSSTKMYIGAHRVNPQISPETHLISYTPMEVTKIRVFVVTVRAREKNSDRYHSTTWLFRRIGTPI